MSLEGVIYYAIKFSNTNAEKLALILEESKEDIDRIVLEFIKNGIVKKTPKDLLYQNKI